MLHKPKRSKKWLWALPIVAIVALLMVGGYFFYKSDQASQSSVVDDTKSSDSIALPGLSGSSQQALSSPSATSNVSSGAGAQPSPGAANSSAPAHQNTPANQRPVSTQTLPNGLKIEEYNPGQGSRTTKPGDTVAVHYIGYLTNNSVFDTSLKGDKQPFAFKLGAGQVIQGWDIGLQNMKVGAVRRLTIPASLAYGANGSPPVIPPNATLVFDVQLMGIQ